MTCEHVGRFYTSEWRGGDMWSQGGRVVLGPAVLGGQLVLYRTIQLVLGSRVRGDDSKGGHPVL